mmetsp:Transcript_11873/g.21789  ORF Transcript_11873/g.21789 Transcript_11873/m.21789 type:complete len:367 (+) Transcript_11873:1194-2294(+)
MSVCATDGVLQQAILLLSDGRIILCVPLAPQLQEIVEHRHPCFLVVDVDIGGEEVHIKDDPVELQCSNISELVLQLQRHALAGLERYPCVPRVNEAKRLALHQSVDDALLKDLHLQAGVFEGEVEEVAVPLHGQIGVEMEGLVVHPHASKTCHQAQPGPAHACSVDAVRNVLVDVVDVHPGRTHEILVGLGMVANLGSYDAEDGGGKGRVMGREWLVEIKIGLLLLESEFVPEQKVGQDKIRLLADSVLVDHQRVEVHQQGVLRPGGVFKGPRLLLEETVVLGMDVGGLVMRQVHFLPRFFPLKLFAVKHSNLGLELLKGLGMLTEEDLIQFAGVLQIHLGHDVRVEIVVNDCGVLIRAGDTVNLE